MKVKVYNIDGKETGREVDLNNHIFGVVPNEHAIYLDVKQYMANKRSGTHKTRERSEIKGSTRKIRRQKGTGMSRVGSIKNPIFRGGGIVFGPRPRDYSFKLNKKLKKVARKSALSVKAQKKEIVVVEDFSYETPKTKNIVNLQENLKLSDKKVLLVLNKHDRNIYLSSRNLKNMKVSLDVDLNTYNIMSASTLLLSESTIKTFDELYNKN